MKLASKFILTRYRLFTLVLLLSAVCLLTPRLRQVTHLATQSPNVEAAALHSAAAVEQLKKDGSYSSLAAAMNAARYQLSPGTGRNTWRASNPAQQFAANFSREGMRIAQTESARTDWQFGMELVGYGYGAQVEPVGEGKMAANGNRIEILKSQISNPESEITEWYVNKPEGLEQGFTLNTPLQSPISNLKSAGSLRLALRVTGELRAELTASGQAVILKDGRGRAVLSYDHLAAWDANHKSLPARMTAEGDTITLEVDDAGAVYPVTIDPLIAQQAKLTAADGAADDKFGNAVAVSGDTAIIGAEQDDASRGAAYVFVRSGSTWTQQAKLVAIIGVASDRFGVSVALNGNTAVIGASGTFEGNVNHGAAYVFTRSGASWSQQARLAVNDGSQVTAFGAGVAVSGETALIGTPFYGLGGETSRGAAYVYTRSGAVWSLQQKLLAGDGAGGDKLGYAVALDGNTALLGATGDDFGAANDQGSAYVFTRSGATWSQQAKLVANDGAANDQFGWSVGLSGDTVVIGSRLADIGGNSNQGAAYVFVRNGAAWSQQQKLLAADGGLADAFGVSVAVSGDLIAVGSDDYDLVGNQNQGAVYLFTRNGAAWSQQQKLRAADGAPLDYLGRAVALSGNTIVGGAYQADVNGNQDQGAAYVFTVCGDLAQQQILTAADATMGDNFGVRIAISGDTAVVSAANDDINGNVDQGSAYIFVRNGATWAQQQKLTASDGAASDGFGVSVAISGNTVVIGAPYHGVAGKTDQGSAYVFTRNGAAWSQQAILTASDGAMGNVFGFAAAISGDTVLIGAAVDTVNAIVQQGSAYVFTRSGATWTQQQKLIASDGQLNDTFGYAVALSGDTAMIGAVGDDINNKVDQGSAYVFTRNGVTWTQQQHLISADGAAGDFFGFAVALSGDTAVVGAAVKSAAYVFTRNGATWSQQQELLAADGTATDRFGSGVAINGNRIAVGAYDATIGNHASQGATYLFVSNGTLWSQYQKLTAADGATNDDFGFAVGLASDAVLVGAPAAQANGIMSAGKVYVFNCLSCPAISLTPATLSGGMVGTSYNQQLTASGGAGPYQYSLSGGVLPPGLTLGSNGLLSGTLTQPGTYSFTITATASNLCNGSQSYTLTVASNCQTITLTPASLPAGLVGIGGYNQPLSASGGVAPYAFSLNPGDSLPPGLSLVNGAIIGAPQQSGVFNFTIKATDAQGCSGLRLYTFTASCQVVTVFPALLPAMTVGAPVNQSFSAAGSDGPYVYGLAGGALPNGLTLSPEGALSGTPTASGNGSFTVRVADAYGCLTTKQYSFSVGCPTITLNPPSLPNGAPGVAYSQNITATGGGAGPYSYSLPLGVLPPPGLFLSSSGLLSGTPTLAGTFNLTVNVSFGGGCTGSRNYTLTINSACPTITVTPQTLAAATVGQAYSANMSANNGEPGFAFAVTAGALPNGLTLSATGGVNGAPTETGVFNFTVTATDANGCTGQVASSITVGCPAITVVPPPPNGSVGNAYNHAFNATGNAGPYTYSPAGGPLPTGLTLSAAGALTGTPTTTGTFNFTVRVGSASGCTGESSFAITIVTCQTVTIVQPSLTEATVGTPYNLQFNVNGGTAPHAWSLPAGTLPAGVTLGAAGAFFGAPTQAGSFPISVRVTDANGCRGDRNYVLIVNPANCPTITVSPDTLPNATNGAAYNQTITATGGTGPYTYALTAGGGLPSGLTLSPAGVISGTVAALGTTQFTITATDANLCTGSRNYQLTANAGCPTITVNPVTVPTVFLNVPYSQTLTAGGGTGPYTFSLLNGVLQNGLTLSAAGVLSGTVPVDVGSVSITVKVTDANGCTGQRIYTVTVMGCPGVTVNPSNATLPVGQAGTQYNQTFTQTGGNGAVSFTVTAGALPNGMTLSTAGALTGAPTAFGDFNFTVTATDANGCAGARAYLLHINAPCATITINPATLSNGTAGTAYNQTATATGGTAPYAFTVSAGALPGGLTLATGGALAGTPNAAGVFNFTIKATDANGCFGTRAYAVTIAGVAVTGLQFYPLSRPVRILDTRAGQGNCDNISTPINGGSSLSTLARLTCEGISIPANAEAIVGNVTVLNQTNQFGYMTVYPDGQNAPVVANMIYGPNGILANNFTVGLGANGNFNIFAERTLDAVVDVSGYYAPPAAGGLYYHPLSKPIRLMDTRANQGNCDNINAPINAGTSLTTLARKTCDGLTIPQAAQAIVGNATVINGSGQVGYLTIYPNGVAAPLAANLIYFPGQILANAFTVSLGANGEFNIFGERTIDVVTDVAGYYSNEAVDVNGTGLLFTPLTVPVRLLDTRAGQGNCDSVNAPIAGGTSLTKLARMTCEGQLIPNNAQAIIGNVTVINQTAQFGYLTLYPTGQAAPLVANMIYQPSQILSNAFVVGLNGTGQFNIFAERTLEAIVDVSGFFAP